MTYGIDDSPVLTELEDTKGYSVSTTLEEDVVTFEKGAYREILYYVAQYAQTPKQPESAWVFALEMNIWERKKNEESFF